MLDMLLDKLDSEESIISILSGYREDNTIHDSEPQVKLLNYQKLFSAANELKYAPHEIILGLHKGYQSCLGPIEIQVELDKYELDYHISLYTIYRYLVSCYGSYKSYQTASKLFNFEPVFRIKK